MRTLLLMALLLALPSVAQAATLRGKVVWNDEGADGIMVRLLRAAKLEGRDRYGAEWEAYTDNYATTGDDGTYRFENLSAGHYVVLVEQGEYWRFSRGRNAAERKRDIAVRVDRKVIRVQRHAVDGEEVVTAIPIEIVKEMEIVAPGSRMLLDEPRPTLEWRGIPPAVAYKVTLYRLHSSSGSLIPIFKDRPTKSTKLEIAEALVNCTYHWQAVAVNRKGKAIAETPLPPPLVVRLREGPAPERMYGSFEVSGQSKSCP